MIDGESLLYIIWGDSKVLIQQPSSLNFSVGLDYQVLIIFTVTVGRCYIHLLVRRAWKW